jgi:PrtD family type I secretion system ABC transporter
MLLQLSYRCHTAWPCNTGKIIMFAMFQGIPSQLREALAACREHLIAAACFSALINILFLAPTLYMMQVYDRVVPTGGIFTLIWLTVIVGLAIAALSALDNVRARLMLRASLKLNEKLASGILTKLVSKARTGSSAQAMREFDVLRQVITGPATTALFDVPWTPIYLIVAFMIHPLLGLLILFSGIVLVILAVFNERRSRERSKIGLQANAASYAAQESLTTHAELVRALGIRGAMTTRLGESRSEGLLKSTEGQLDGTRYSAIVKFIRMFMQSAALGVAAALAVKGEISTGTIIAASVLLSRALQPIEQLVGSWSAIIQARFAWQTLKTLFEEEECDTANLQALPVPRGEITLNNVSFRNPQSTAFLLNNITANIIPGEVTALVGNSGAGKSTLARIIAGAILPDLGELRIDKAKYADWDPDLLAKYIGYLPQVPTLLSGTIAENISKFAILRGEQPEDVDAKIIRAAQVAGVHEMILQLPGGYNARIGDPQFGISGGQQQRIALARALYGDPKVLVLDEPSSSLDSNGEQALLRAIAAFKAMGASILLVAHRASVMGVVDKLLVLNGGTIVHQGPREEVMNDLRSAQPVPNVVPMARGGA